MRSPRLASSTWTRRRRRTAFGARSAPPAMDRGIRSAEGTVAAMASITLALKKVRPELNLAPLEAHAFCATDRSVAMLECARGSCPHAGMLRGQGVRDARRRSPHRSGCKRGNRRVLQGRRLLRLQQHLRPCRRAGLRGAHDQIAPDRTYQGQTFSDEVHFV